jgi:hypothetical protein
MKYSKVKAMNDILCDSLSCMQAELFKMSVKLKINSDSFIKSFMNSDIARHLDSSFDHLQWAGKEYIMESILDELHEKLTFNHDTYDLDTMEWIGYVYRYWHFYTGESSKQIYRQAPSRIMQRVYPAYHTMDVTLAIDRLKEDYMEQKEKVQANH